MPVLGPCLLSEAASCELERLQPLRRPAVGVLLVWMGSSTTGQQKKAEPGAKSEPAFTPAQLMEPHEVTAGRRGRRLGHAAGQHGRDVAGVLPRRGGEVQRHLHYLRKPADWLHSRSPCPTPRPTTSTSKSGRMRRKAANDLDHYHTVANPVPRARNRKVSGVRVRRGRQVTGRGREDTEATEETVRDKSERVSSGSDQSTLVDNHGRRGDRMMRLSPIPFALVALIGSAIPSTGASAEPKQTGCNVYNHVVKATPAAIGNTSSGWWCSRRPGGRPRYPAGRAVLRRRLAGLPRTSLVPRVPEPARLRVPMGEGLLPARRLTRCCRTPSSSWPQTRKHPELVHAPFAATGYSAGGGRPLAVTDGGPRQTDRRRHRLFSP